MSVIPLTLTISLCLVFTFLVFFLREHARARMSSAERDALLPLNEEKPRLATPAGTDGPIVVSLAGRKPKKSRSSEHGHGGCGGDGRGSHERCAGCQNHPGDESEHP